MDRSYVPMLTITAPNQQIIFPNTITFYYNVIEMSIVCANIRNTLCPIVIIILYMSDLVNLILS